MNLRRRLLALMSAVLFLTGGWLVASEWVPVLSVGASQVDKSVSPEPFQAPATPSPTPRAPLVVPAAPPVHISVPALDFEVDMDVMEQDGTIDPPITDYPWLTYWVSNVGVAPGSHMPDTTYLACHTSSKKSDAQAPCNSLSRNGRLQPGHQVVVQTTQGVLTYEVTSTRQIRRGFVSGDDEANKVEPNRLVWFMCYLDDKGRTEFIYTVFATLVAYERIGSNEHTGSAMLPV